MLRNLELFPAMFGRNNSHSFLIVLGFVVFFLKFPHSCGFRIGPVLTLRTAIQA